MSIRTNVPITRLPGTPYSVAGDIEPQRSPREMTAFFVAGAHQGNAPEKPFTVATSMYRIEDEFGVSV